MIGRWQGVHAERTTAQRIRECRATIARLVEALRETRALLVAHRKHLRSLTRTPKRTR